MSKVPIQKDDTLHSLNRGVLKKNLFRSPHDFWRFLEVLRYKNHDANIRRWQNDIKSIVNGHHLPWPDSWHPQDPLVRIDAYILMNNHYHLILTEIREGGISAFMKKLSNTYTGYFQIKYDWDERLFAATYKSVHVLSDNQLRKLFVYVLVKNAFERYSGGIKEAIDNFAEAFEFAKKYSFSGLGGVMGDRRDLISDDSLFEQFFDSPQEFKEFSRDQMNRYGAFLEEVDDMTLE